MDYLTGLGMDNVRTHEQALTGYALDKFRELEDIETYGPTDLSVRGGVVSFYMSDIHPHDISQVLDSYGVAIRAGPPLRHAARPQQAQRSSDSAREFLPLQYRG